ncbi:MAG: hypothetical protein RIQ94_1854 [Pseudomonadota bacterium]
MNNIPAKDLIEFLGVTKGFVSQLKTEKSKLPAKDCIRVSERFGIPLHKLRKDIYPDPDNCGLTSTETK